MQCSSFSGKLKTQLQSLWLLKNPGCGGKNEGVENLNESCTTAYCYRPPYPWNKATQHNQKPSYKYLPFSQRALSGHTHAQPHQHARERAAPRAGAPAVPAAALYLPAPCPSARTQPPGSGRQRLLLALQEPGPAARTPRASRSAPLRSCRARGGGSTRPISAGLVGRASSPMGGRVVELRGR